MHDDDGRAGGTVHRHGPATTDWPRGYGEATWWPIVVTAGAVGIYAGIGLLVLAHLPDNLVSPLIGAVAFAGGLVVFFVGLLGWHHHAFVKRYRLFPAPASVTRYRWGMVLFLVAEVMTFGGGLAYYAFVRVGPWPPGELPHLLSSLVAVNTALLVASSLTLHVAHESLRHDRRRRFVGLLGLTVLLGVLFLGGQAYEYYAFVVREGFTPSEGVFASAFFGLTGLHGLHVGMGIVLLSIVLGRALSGQYTADRDVSVGTASMYWHFVDAVWLVLVAALYVGATVWV